MKELMEFVKGLDIDLRRHYSEDDEHKIMLARTVKIMEELGELCNEVLSHASLQRTDKLERHERSNMEEEFADVLITLLMLARTLKIDVLDIVDRKVEKIKSRRL